MSKNKTMRIFCLIVAVLGIIALLNDFDRSCAWAQKSFKMPSIIYWAVGRCRCCSLCDTGFGYRKDRPCARKQDPDDSG